MSVCLCVCVPVCVFVLLIVVCNPCSVRLYLDYTPFPEIITFVHWISKIGSLELTTDLPVTDQCDVITG